MTMFASHPATRPALSATAELLLDRLRATPTRWIVLDAAHAGRAAGLGEAELTSAVRELEAADLVVRASYGPLLYIR